MRTSNAALLAVLLAAPAAAQSLESFSARGQSAVNYSLAAARPQVSCAALLKFADPDVTMLSAVTVAAAGDVPEHCRVSGLIAPEIRFEINLPAAWNRRFYLFGNGGFAGETPESPPKAVVRANALRSNFVTA